MLVVPLRRGDAAIGALSVLDRRDAAGYGAGEVDRAALFADLAVAALSSGGERGASGRGGTLGGGSG
jgi:hypothetical protein